MVIIGPRPFRSVRRYRPVITSKGRSRRRDVGRLSPVFDPTQAPPRPAHRVHVGEAALSPAGNPDWSGVGGEHGRAMLVARQKHAPNLADAAWIPSRARRSTPSGSLPNMRERRSSWSALHQRPDRLPAPVRGGRLLPHCICRACTFAARAAIPAATSPGFRATTTPPRSFLADHGLHCGCGCRRRSRTISRGCRAEPGVTPSR